MNIPPVQAPINSYKVAEKEVSGKGKNDNSVAKQSGKAQMVQNQNQAAAVYTPISNESEKKVTYDKPKGSENVEKLVEPDHKTIDKLKAESEKVYSQLRQLVEQLLLKQGYSIEQYLSGEISSDQVEVDDATRAEAAKLIADDGPLGAEAVSDRIVEFAIAVSGGDKTKFEMLRGAIQAGFDEAQKLLGGQLPDVSKKTHTLVMEKLDKWYQESADELT